MTHLMEKDTHFFFSSECKSSFEILKKKLTEAPILVSPDWDLPFKIMCDASDFAIRDRKGAENLAADHLSILENPHQGDLVGMERNDNFTHESLNMISLNPDNEPSWFADIANYLVGNVLVKGMSSQQKKKFFKLSGGAWTGRKLWISFKLATMVPPRTSWPELHHQEIF
ncbi:reverse transcriptase domain-containing protein [Tanacetum coccineum]